MTIALLAAAATGPPLLPDGDEAREWAEQELGDPVYRVAEPTVFDRVARAIGDGIASVFSGDAPDGWGGILALVTCLVVVGVLVASLIVWGRPRARTRVSPRHHEHFGADADASAARLRADAESAAAASEWDLAVVLRFRALARALLERGVLEPTPGTTARRFAGDLAAVFPATADRAPAVAASFDDVRYLRRHGSAEIYRRVADLDTELQGSRPATAAVR